MHELIKPTLAAVALMGLLAISACDRRGDEYTSPQDRSGDMSGTGDTTATPPADSTTPTTPPAGGTTQ